MSVVAQTPQRPVPGAYTQTPAPKRYQSSLGQPPFPRSSSVTSQQQSVSPKQNASQAPAPNTTPEVKRFSPTERGAKTINDTLLQESRYPELDNYVGQGISSEYDISNQPAWAPFEKRRTYNIPESIFEQCNRGQLSRIMGLFADLNLAWIAIDSALYLWDYTRPNSELVGFEDQSNPITAVQLTVPRAGVFVPSIQRMLVVATTAEVILIGLGFESDQSGGLKAKLYQTHLSVVAKNMSIQVIEGSAATGRVFFAAHGNEVYELTYQQEEKWFMNRCGKVNHTTNYTTKGFKALTPVAFSHNPAESVIQMVVDDSRGLLYTLSSKSTIRTFHMKPDGGLSQVIEKSLQQTLNNIGHMITESQLISSSMSIVAIHPIPSREATKLHLMATTSTGCRIFMSATSSYGYSIMNSASAPSSMQVQHVKFPPSEAASTQRGPSSQVSVYGNSQTTNTSSRALMPTRIASRYPPGYFCCFVTKDAQSSSEVLFMSAPDAGRIGRSQDPSRPSKFSEVGLWLSLASNAEAIGLATPPFNASSSPTGFGNELAVELDKQAAEIAILTNTGIHVVRRRKLVDIFAAAVQFKENDEGLEGEVKKFIRQYGRGETAATALAVACGQGSSVGADSRVAKITDSETLENARMAFVDHGGKPLLNENSVVDNSLPLIDMVRPSPRHEGLSLYVTRLVRSLWKSPIARELTTPTGGFEVSPTVSISKLQDVQRDLTKLQEFLEKNKNFIDGLAGPDALGRVSTKQEEISLQAEHRALHSLVVLISNIIEGISFVLVLFDERMAEIMMSLPNETRQQVRDLTFEGLFSTENGKSLAKELVKAIVARNIANGFSVDTVAEALRRRCGSFCSSDDVINFRAQEQLKKATQVEGESENRRNLLNESLKLFKEVVSTLTMDQLQWVVNSYISSQFYAGAIELCLIVAQEKDRANIALAWIQDGRPEQDQRANIFNARKSCYNLIHQIITQLDLDSEQAQDVVDGQYTVTMRRRSEAYDVIDTSEDEVFQTDLYDWYLEIGRTDRLLNIRSPYIVTYLERKSVDDIAPANLLWQYYSQANRHHDAAAVQLLLAKSGFAMSLDKRVEYLSRARVNASMHTPGVARQKRQVLLREISDLLDIASIQTDLIQRLKSDSRISPDRKSELVNNLDGRPRDLTELFNLYADEASYFDICLLIFQAADHRIPTDIRATWSHLLDTTHQQAVTNTSGPLPYEAIATQVRSLAPRLSLSESTFPIPDLVPMLCRYAFEFQRDVAPRYWVMDLFLDLTVPFDAVWAALEAMFYNDERPFHGRNRRFVAEDLLYVAKRWFAETVRGGPAQMLGGEASAQAVGLVLDLLVQNGLEGEAQVECQELMARIERVLR